MIRDLPRISRYVTLVIWRKQNGEEVNDEEPPSEMRRQMEERFEMRQWSDLSLELEAMQVNLLQELLRFAPQWKKTPPASDVVGPRSWWGEEQRRKRNKEEQKQEKKVARDEKKPASVLDAMKAMGFNPDQHGPGPT